MFQPLTFRQLKDGDTFKFIPDPGKGFSFVTLVKVDSRHWRVTEGTARPFRQDNLEARIVKR